MPKIEEFASVLPVYYITAALTILFAAGAVAVLAYAFKARIFDEVEDLKYRILEVEDRPLARPQELRG